MTQTPKSPRYDDLFFSGVVESYLANPRFLRRDWLSELVNEKLEEPACRFVLITAEPGAGKSTFVAQLARNNPEWLRYFIRRDQRAPLANAGARSFLLRIGFQLSDTHPNLFRTSSISAEIEQEIDKIAISGSAIGVRINKLRTSPFFKQIIVKVRQSVRQQEGVLRGIHIDSLTTDPNLLDLSDLQQMALFTPAHALRVAQPDGRIVVLVDALDELRFHHEREDVLHWLIYKTGELPGNVRIVLTSRPADATLRHFMNTHRDRLQQIVVRLDDGAQTADASRIGKRLSEDLSQYATALAQQENLQVHWKDIARDRSAFINEAVEKADGNLGYLDAIARAIDDALQDRHPDSIRTLLSLTSLPPHLEGLHYFFLNRIRTLVNKQIIEVDTEDGDVVERYSWEAVYRHILGVLSVAQAPLTVKQIHRLGKIRVEQSHVSDAVERLTQFLDPVERSYKLYHVTLLEFVRNSQTQLDGNVRENPFYTDARRYHRRISHYYLQSFSDNWLRCDLYGLTYLPYHLSEAGQQSKLRELLLGSPDWMQAKLGIFGHSDAYISDLALATRGFKDPLTLPEVGVVVQLHAARLVARHYAQTYVDDDLRTLVWLDRTQEALSHARTRIKVYDIDGGGQFNGLLAICVAVNKKDKSATQLFDNLLSELDELLSKVISARDHAFRDLVAAMVELGESKRAGEMALRFKEENEGQPVKWVVLFVLALIEVGEFDAARQMIDETISRHKRQSAKALGILAARLKQRGDVHQGNALFALGKKVISDFTDWEGARARTDLAAAMMQARETQEAEAFFEQAQMMALAIDHPSNGPEALGRLALELANCDLTQKADKVFRLALEKTDLAIYPEDEAFLMEAKMTLAGYLAQAGNIEQAVEVFNHAYRAKRQLVGEGLLLKLGELESLIGLMDTLGKEGETNSANHIIMTLVHRADKLRALSALAAALAQAGQKRQAEETLHQARAISVQMRDSFTEREALKTLALALVETRRFDMARKVAAAIKHKGIRERTLSQMVPVLAQAGHFQEAEQIAFKIVSEWRRLEALVTLAGALNASKLNASGIIDRIVSAEAIRQLRSGPRSAWHQQEAFYDAVSALATNGRWGMPILDTVFDNLQQFQTAFIQREERDRSLELLAIGAARAERAEVAREAISRARDKERTFLQRKAIEALANTGRFDEAGEIIDEMPPGPWKQGAIDHMVSALIHAKRSEKVREYLQVHPSAQSSLQVLLALATELARAGKMSEAEEKFSLLMERISGLKYQELALKEWATALGQSGQFVEAIKVMEHFSVDAFISVISAWHGGYVKNASAAAKPEVQFLSALGHCVRIAGWLREDWRAIDKLLAAPGSDDRQVSEQDGPNG